MNYIFGGLSLLIILKPIDTWIREKQLRNQKSLDSKSKIGMNLDGIDVGETVL